jgi:hypothetical protein
MDVQARLRAVALDAQAVSTLKLGPPKNYHSRVSSWPYLVDLLRTYLADLYERHVPVLKSMN